MLKEVEISFYQSHKSTQLSFHPGMNVITGSSHKGKSAIIRSLLWVINNRPTGEDFKSWCADEDDIVNVSMEFDNGWVIKKREKGKNSYECQGIDGKLEALRTDVPEVVKELINITDYNIQTQFQPYFMLQSTPGERAKKINELVGLDIIDILFKKLDSKIDKTRNETVFISQEITKIKQEIEDLSYLDSVETKIADIDHLINQYTVKEQRLRTLQILHKNLTNLNEEIAIQKDVLLIEDSIITLKNKISLYFEKENKLAKITTLKDQLGSIKFAIFHKQSVLVHEKSYLWIKEAFNRYIFLSKKVALLGNSKTKLNEIQKQIDLEKEWLYIEPSYIAIKEKLITYKNKEQNFVRYDEKLKTIKDIISKIKVMNQNLVSLISKYCDIITKNKTCPKCFSPINDEAIKTLKRNLGV